MEPSPLTSVSLSWECLLVPLAAVSRPTWSKNQTGARKWGPEHPHPRSQDTARVVAVARLPTQPLSPMASGCLRPSHTASKLLCGHLPWQAMMENSREAKGSSSALVPWLRPGGGRQGPSPINDWVSQHQHSQHAAGIPAALSRPTDGPWCPHPPEARARLQKRPVPSG